jgi:osmotically-inducible protein OsmY
MHCRAVAFLVAGLVSAGPAAAFDPVTSLISKGVSTALDVRSKDEVKADIEIDGSVTGKLNGNKGDDYKDVSFLVFARHGVLVGYARTDDARRKAEELARTEKRLRSLRNDVVIGTPGGGMAANAMLDKKIDLKLTATKGVSSVNMRWKVYGGEVFLTGVAKTQAEADLAVKTVRGADGVKNVRSSLRIGKA